VARPTKIKHGGNKILDVPRLLGLDSTGLDSLNVINYEALTRRSLSLGVARCGHYERRKQ
jgi:hypothetical protein